MAKNYSALRNSREPYSFNKFAVHGFTEALRKDLGATDIRVTEILPGLVRSNFAINRLRGDQKSADEFYESAAGYLLPEDIADTVLYALELPLHANVSQIVIEPTRTTNNI